MNTKIVFTWVIAACCTAVNAQVTFQKKYGNTDYQQGYAVKQCYDGGYIATGFSVPYIGQYNVYLVRTDALGDTLWTKTYGGDNMVGFDVIQTSDSNFVWCGYKNSSNPQVQLKKVDAAGNTLWTRVFSAGWGQAVQQTFDGGFIIAGAQLYRTDAGGNLVWTKPVTGGQAMYVIQTPDSNYIMTGFGGNNLFIAKTDTGGNNMWTKYYPGTLPNTSNNTLVRTSDGGYIVTGMDSQGQTLLLKTDAAGDTTWTKLLPNYQGSAVVQTTDGGYAIAGLVTDSVLSSQMSLVKTDAGGTVQWMNDYGFSGSEWSKSLRQTSDGGYMIGGFTTSYPSSNDDVFLVKTDSLGNYVGMGLHELEEQNGMILYPNPAVSLAKMEVADVLNDANLMLFNACGQLVKEVKNISGQTLTLHRENLPAGLYFIRLTQGSKVVATGSIVFTD